MTEQEKGFLRRMKSGEEEAWRSFLDAVMPGLREKIGRVVADEEQAEDMANDILVFLVSRIRHVAIDSPDTP